MDRKCANSNRVPDALTPSKVLDSTKLFVCSRSGGIRGFAPNSDTKFATRKLAIK
ncbi:hypothetical protein [uncultured Helicobacter sp.]|uniref:hypothetical protein n=1 Tax=uncultured Helicobacter sp. TaxID=175537 RepID=UPI001C3AC48D|nr:hypothetical protein [Candidatus Helicobacter avicola]